MPDPLRFDAWMQRALHEPESGYYSRRIETVGGRGDFTTAPMISEALAAAIAQWASAALRETRCRHLVEIGPGTGILAMQVWKRLPLLQRLTTSLHLVETSDKLTAIQRKTLGNGALWHATPTEALAACRGKAVIYSNELVDAFPCRRFELARDGWREIHVGEDEVLLPAEDLPESCIFDRDFPVGQRVEVHESYRQWLQAWLPHWNAGRMLTIDYGGEARGLYSRQPGGSVRAYLLQQRLTGMDIYQNVGRQDLTADVNFTDLMNWSRPWITESRLQTLAEFLADTGAQKRLLDPQGAGGAFQVLEQEL